MTERVSSLTRYWARLHETNEDVEVYRASDVDVALSTARSATPTAHTCHGPAADNPDCPACRLNREARPLPYPPTASHAEGE